MSPETKVWQCPKCERTFREHVFGEGTYGSGPICNVCCAPLVLMREEHQETAIHASAGAGGLDIFSSPDAPLRSHRNPF